jgi:hypothetical protein
MTTRDRSNQSKEQTIHNSNHKREERGWRRREEV